MIERVNDVNTMMKIDKNITKEISNQLSKTIDNKTQLFGNGSSFAMFIDKIIRIVG